MNRYAVVENGIVTRLVMWDGTSPHSYPGTLVLISDPAVDVNFTYDGSVFAPPDLTAELERAAARDRLAVAYATLRQWADDADSAVTSWDGWTQAQKNAALKTVITRVGAFFDRFADLLQATGRS